MVGELCMIIFSDLPRVISPAGQHRGAFDDLMSIDVESLGSFLKVAAVSLHGTMLSFQNHET